MAINPKPIVLRIFIFFIILLPLNCLAQSVISGRVLNHADNKPVPDATVFLNNASIGTKTIEDGTFILQNVKAGNYELVVSSIGFETHKQILVVANYGFKLPDIVINPKSLVWTEVTIHARKKPKPGEITTDDAEWPEYLEQFKKAFFGTSDLAKDCEILNPQVINMHYDAATNSLFASSDDFVEIVNNALGYKVKYLLTEFWRNGDNPKSIEVYYAGEDYFEELKGSPAEMRRWQKKRIEVFEGSAMHFFRSASKNKIYAEGFRVLRVSDYINPDRPSDDIISAKIKFFTTLTSKASVRRDSLVLWAEISKLPKALHKIVNFPLDSGDVVKPVNNQGNYSLGCDNEDLYVSYNKDHHFWPVSLTDYMDSPNNDQTTLIHFKSPFILFDSFGNVHNLNGATFTGVWGRTRMAGLLPFDYEAPK